jgi:hypothetical protein
MGSSVHSLYGSRHRERDARRGAHPRAVVTIDALLPRTWIALLRGRVRCALAATTGSKTLPTSPSICSRMRMGMIASALLRYGPVHGTVLIDGMSEWMAHKGFTAVNELRGMLSVLADTDGAAYERAPYVTALTAANAGASSPLVSRKIERAAPADLGPRPWPLSAPSPDRQLPMRVGCIVCGRSHQTWANAFGPDPRADAHVDRNGWRRYAGVRSRVYGQFAECTRSVWWAPRASQCLEVGHAWAGSYRPPRAGT